MKHIAKKTLVDGIKFDSILESRYYKQLIWLKKAGEIKDFELQPAFVLQDTIRREGLPTIPKTKYVGDFKIINNDGSIEVIDVKPASKKALDPVFKLKYKWFIGKYPDIPLKCITHTDVKGWHELKIY